MVWYGCIKPIYFKINDIDPKRRFVNLFDNFSPLCGTPTFWQFSKTYLNNKGENYANHTTANALGFENLECILRKNVFDKRWVSIFSTLTKFEQHLCLQIDEMSNFTCYLQSLVPGKVYMQNMYITIHKWSNYNTILYKN